MGHDPELKQELFQELLASDEILFAAGTATDFLHTQVVCRDVDTMAAVIAVLTAGAQAVQLEPGELELESAERCLMDFEVVSGTSGLQPGLAGNGFPKVGGILFIAKVSLRESPGGILGPESAAPIA